NQDPTAHRPIRSGKPSKGCTFRLDTEEAVMGVLSRLTALIKAKMSQLLDQAEDPAVTMDYSYERQLELLRDVKRGIVEVVTSRRRLELQAEKLRQNADTLERQARQALASGREDLARLALQRKQTALQQLQGLDGQI